MTQSNDVILLCNNGYSFTIELFGDTRELMAHVAFPTLMLSTIYSGSQIIYAFV